MSTTTNEGQGLDKVLIYNELSEIKPFERGELCGFWRNMMYPFGRTDIVER